jgi:ribonuclease P/MRP protein subunit RPP40
LANRVGNIEGINDLKDDLMALTKWCYDWQMEFNVKKCKVMHFGHHNLGTIYTMNEVDLTETKEEKDLGVLICQDLKVSRQCLTAAKKANQILGLIYRTFSSRSKDILVRLYKSLVRPHLDYCIQAWRPHLQKDIDVLEKVQRRATRMIEGFKGMDYEDRLNNVGLTTLETRRIRADLLEVYKIIKGIEGVNEETFFERRRDSICRGHGYMLLKKRFRTNLGKFSFGNRVINLWNNLPQDVVLADSIVGFKIGLDRYFRCKGGFK